VRLDARDRGSHSKARKSDSRERTIPLHGSAPQSKECSADLQTQRKGSRRPELGPHPRRPRPQQRRSNVRKVSLFAGPIQLVADGAPPPTARRTPPKSSTASASPSPSTSAADEGRAVKLARDPRTRQRVDQRALPVVGNQASVLVQLAPSHSTSTVGACGRKRRRVAVTKLRTNGSSLPMTKRSHRIVIAPLFWRTTSLDTSK